MPSKCERGLIWQCSCNQRRKSGRPNSLEHRRERRETKKTASQKQNQNVVQRGPAVRSRRRQGDRKNRKVIITEHLTDAERLERVNAKRHLPIELSVEPERTSDKKRLSSMRSRLVWWKGHRLWYYEGGYCNEHSRPEVCYDMATLRMRWADLWPWLALFWVLITGAERRIRNPLERGGEERIGEIGVQTRPWITKQWRNEKPHLRKDGQKKRRRGGKGEEKKKKQEKKKET